MIPTQQDILDNVELVRKTVNNMRQRHTNSLMDEGDLFSEGIFGLFKAFELFDPEKSSWETFATRKIKYAMMEAHRGLYKQYRQARRFGLPEPVNLYLDEEVGDGHTSRHEFLEGEFLSEDELVDLMDSTIGLRKTWGRLTYRQRNIMKLMSEGMTQGEVAERIGVTPGAIHAQYHKAVGKIQKYHGEQEAR
jgi:RNA polymerase sigma factor (sigma-70 family)